MRGRKSEVGRKLRETGGVGGEGREGESMGGQHVIYFKTHNGEANHG